MGVFPRGPLPLPGSAVPSMITDILNSMVVTIPPQEVFDSFENIVQPMYIAMSKNKKESQQLEKLRDALLTKLILGEIDVSSLDI